MAILLSRQNVQADCQEFWKVGRGLSAGILSSKGGEQNNVDLLKLCTLSSLVMDVKNSLKVPDSLSHMLDINIIIPDFSEEVVNVLCDLVEGVNPEVFTNIATFNELTDLVELLNFTARPSLMVVDGNDVKTLMDREDNITKVEGGECVPFEIIEVDPVEIKTEVGEYIEENAEEVELDSDATHMAGNNTFPVSPPYDDISDVVNLTRSIVMTLDSEDVQRLRQFWESLVTWAYKDVRDGDSETNRKMWTCCLCNNYQSKFNHNVFSHIDRKHTPNISHQCLLCPFTSKTRSILVRHVQKDHSLRVSDLK